MRTIANDRKCQVPPPPIELTLSQHKWTQFRLVHNAFVLFYKTTSCKRREEGTTCLLCLVNINVCVSMGDMERNRVTICVIWLREKCAVCLSLELQQTECALMRPYVRWMVDTF